MPKCPGTETTQNGKKTDWKNIKSSIMKKLLYGFLFLTLFNRVYGDPPVEGMWIPILLEQLNISEMREMGLQMTADEIFSVEHSSLKDAIVNFGGCTGSMISPNGLLLTNHHCGYGYIQKHSSVENDYLKNGYWATEYMDELPNPGLKVSFMIDIKDVTNRVLAGFMEGMNMEERNGIIEENSKSIEGEAIENTHYQAFVRSFFNGNKFFLFITETFMDVRLVGAPPSSIGKFGGDIDNWMWPRHTGDFSLFRIYADKDNNPAEYSEQNQPYKPKHFLPISLKGVEKGDFTMVFGYPGRTQEYLQSKAVEHLVNITDPARIKLRTMRLYVINKYMKQSDKTRIQYASKQSGISNGWKKWQGEIRGLKRIDAVKKKKEFEKEFQLWADESDNEYKNLMADFEQAYSKYDAMSLNLEYLNEAAFTIEVVLLAYRFRQLVKLSEEENPDEQKIRYVANALSKRVQGFHKNYNASIDNEIFPQLIKAYYQDIDKQWHPDIFKFIEKKFKTDFMKYGNWVFKKSMFPNQQKLTEFLGKYKPKQAKKLKKDPVYALMNSVLENYYANIRNNISTYSGSIDSLNMVYMNAMMQMLSGKRFYADANSTMRIAYGKVDDYKPLDGVTYDYYTTIDGIIEKWKTGEEDYALPDKLIELYRKKDYGRYAQDGTVHTCFLASNHTTGGNSGSPVINGKGELIGLNFDRNWEGTLSDIMYDPDQCRNISVDIRYVLFIIDKLAGATQIIDEIKLIE
jgi:Peptidase S46